MASFSFSLDNDDALNMTVASTASAMRKRKREDERSVLGDSFVIKPHSSSVFDSLVKLTPAVILPRPYIPLQWLAGYPSRLLSIPVPLPALDIPGNVVIVKVEGERQLAAVEKVKDGVYTLYKLSTQLKMKDVRKTFAQVKKSRQNSESLRGSVDFTPEILGSEWWSGLAALGISVDGPCTSESTIKLIMGSSDLDNYDDRSPSLTPSVNAPLSPPVVADAVCEKIETFADPTLGDILEKTGVQYFKTLYIAKTSLAYFAKSTLSRARVAMQREIMLPSPSNPSSDLHAFLLEMHLPFDQMDIKYRKAIPQIVTEDQVENAAVFKPGEEEYVQQWRLATWQERLVQMNDPTLKRKVEELKIRETELQIILLLEVLALEREQATATKGSTNESQTSSKKKSKSESRKKEKRKLKTGAPDPKLLLDLLVDRLCIWRSIGSGSSDGLEEESSDQKKVTDREHDHLRHFCVEVVLAFYASRLPEECASINKKCGGSNSRRGIDSPRQAKMKKDKRSTKRPSLLRSITAPAAASLTREASVDTLAALVAADSRGTVRGGTLNSKSFAKREVQISSRNGQRKVDEELKEAIDALKKPNRVAAASELVDESARRLSKRPKKSARNPLAKVQVMATPKRRRTIPPMHQPMSSLLKNTNGPDSQDPFYVPRDLDPRTRHDIPGTPLRRDSLLQDFDTIPSTSPFESTEDRRPSVFRSTPGSFVTPQKRSRRPDLGSVNFVPSSTTKIQETLTRSFPQSIASSGVSKFMPQPVLGLVDDTSSPAGGVRLFDNGAVGETPSKAATAPTVSKIDMQEKKEVSIYDTLGWDDDYDL